jgi:hypothetical protein
MYAVDHPMYTYIYGSGVILSGHLDVPFYRPQIGRRIHF